jgi:tetratricopeptide (TPR) repeat protein
MVRAKRRAYAMPPIMLDRRRCSCGPVPRSEEVARLEVGLLLIAVLTAASAGCASFGLRGPAPEELAACRELSRQGASAMELGQWARAESLLLAAVEASPNDSEARRYLAEALWHRGAAREALAQMEAAIDLDRTDAMLTARAGEMLLAVGANDEALTHADAALRLNPKLEAAWALRGRVYSQMNQPDRALTDLHRALHFAPTSPDILLDVAKLYRQRNQPERALATLHQLLDTYPPGEEPQLPLLLEGQTLAELGRPRQAAESLLAATRRGPPNAEVLYWLAQAQSSTGDYAAATSAAQQALAIDSNHQASQQLLSQLAALTSADLRR